VGEGSPASPPESLVNIKDKFFSGRV